MRIIYLTAATTILALAMGGCSKKNAEDDTDETETTGVTSTGATTSTGTSLNVSATKVSDNITSVEDGMVPASLEGDEGAALLDNGPCEGTDGFFDCQPNLLKLYIGMGKSMVGNVNTFVSSVAKGLFKNVKVPADGVEVCGSVTNPEAAAKIVKVDYCVTSETKFKALMHAQKGAFMHLSVDGGVYEVTGNLSNGPDGDGENTAKVHAVVTYTSADTFDVKVEITDMSCADSDVRAPEKIVLKIGRDAGVWQGKSMLYLPRWLHAEADGVTCATASTDAMAMAFFTDFVGNDDATTASIYFMPRTVSALTAIDSYEVSDFCLNYPTACVAGRGFGDPNVIATTYTNPFCVSGDATTWGGACSVGVEAVDAPTYSNADKWVAPSVLKDFAITMPETL